MSRDVSRSCQSEARLEQMSQTNSYTLTGSQQCGSVVTAGRSKPVL